MGEIDMGFMLLTVPRVPRGRHTSRRFRRLLGGVTTGVLVLAGSALAAPPALAAGGSLYVAATSPTCTATGPGTPDSPYCSISAAVKVATSGDTVHVASGTYPEQVTLPATASNVTVVADDPDVTVLGSDSLDSATWTATSGTAWSTPIAGTSAPSQLFDSDTLLTKALAAGSTTTDSWFFDTASRLLYVDLGGPQPAPGDGLDVSIRAYGFLIRGATGVTVQGFTTARQSTAGVQLDTGASADTVRGVTARESASYGLNDSGGSNNLVTDVTASGNASVGIRMQNTTGDTVTASTASGNGLHGISVQGGSGAAIRGNLTTANLRPGQRVAAGIDVSQSSADAVVENNTSYGNDDSGIEIYTGSTGAVVRRNLSYDNGDHGVDVSVAPDTAVVSNTVVGNSASGLNVEGGSTGTSLRNNIAAYDAVATPRSKGDIRVDAASTSGTTIDDDLVFESDGVTPTYEWSGVTYSSLGALQAASGQETHGLQADPQFVSLSNRNLALTAASPAVDAADTSAPGWTDPDLTGHPPVDDQQVTDTGTGPVTFADLGALELTDVPPPPVDAAPTAALSASPAQVDAGGSVTLDAGGSSDDHGITGYVFDCGNNTVLPSQTDATATCTYPNAGSFQASVTVTDTAGQSDKASQTVTVSQPAPSAPTAALVVTPPQVTQGGSATLDASTSAAGAGRRIVSYRFSCRAGTTSAAQTGPSKTCTYSSAGSYTASVTVTDDIGQTATATAAVTVTALAKPTARLTVSPASPRRNQAVKADASASTPGAATAPLVAYQFKCGTRAKTAWRTSPTTSCTFPTAGTTRVTVWVKDSRGQVATTYQAVRVRR
jgi:parallel beta-helix repeat protein